MQRSTPQLVTNRGKITVDAVGQTSMARVFAGGDVVRGGSTVILAMRDGRAAAAAIHEALKDRKPATAGGMGANVPDVAPGFSPAPSPTDAGLKPGATKAATNATVENRILAKRLITPEIAWFEVQATGIARHWQAGQFATLRSRAEKIRRYARALQQRAIRPRRMPWRLHFAQKNALLLVSPGAELGIEDVAVRPELERQAKNLKNVAAHALTRLLRLFGKWRKIIERLHFLARVSRNQT